MDGTSSTPTFPPMDTHGDGIAIPERAFVDNIIDHIRQHDEIYGIARAYDSDENLDQPWTIGTLRSLIRRVTNEGKLPKSNQANHPGVQQMTTLDDAELQQKIRRTYSRNNPDHKALLLYDAEVEGMWIKDRPLSIRDRNTRRKAICIVSTWMAHR
jgi:hypothetical protein